MRNIILVVISFIIPLSSVIASEPAKTNEIVTSNFIFETGDIPSVHSSTITETSKGLLVAFFGGEYEGSPDTSIYLSKGDGKNWSKPVIVAEGIVEGEKRKACYNPVLYTFPDGEILLFYKIGENVQDWRGYFKRSNDDGETWSEPIALPKGFLGPTKNKPILIDNKLICPSSTEHDGWQVHFEYTEDKGKTWRKSEPINSKPWNIIQASIITKKDSTLQIICRSQNEQLISAFSKDQGETWSAPVALYLPNNNSGTDAVTLSDSRQALVYNHVRAKQSAYIDNARSPLNLAISNDGITWYASTILDNSTKGEYSYPSIIQGSDGKIHIVYTWRRENIKYIKVDTNKIILKSLIDNVWPK